ncbi:MAG: hypothetical protein P8X39_04690 [Desulfofustis sp.]|jgi:hypothetical protein
MKKINNSSNYKRFWDITSQAEKERVFRMFLKEYGENYTSADFVAFLKKRYKVATHTPTFSNWRQSF